MDHLFLPPTKFYSKYWSTILEFLSPNPLKLLQSSKSLPLLQKYLWLLELPHIRASLCSKTLPSSSIEILLFSKSCSQPASLPAIAAHLPSSTGHPELPALSTTTKATPMCQEAPFAPTRSQSQRQRTPLLYYLEHFS